MDSMVSSLASVLKVGQLAAYPVAVLILMVIVLIAWIGGAWNQQMINRGVKDAPWFWFDSDPPSFPRKGVNSVSAERKERK